MFKIHAPKAYLSFEISVQGAECCEWHWVSGMLRKIWAQQVSSFEESLTLTAIYVSLWMAATGYRRVWTKASSFLLVARTSAEKATPTIYTKGWEKKSFAAVMLTSATGMSYWPRGGRPSHTPRKRSPRGWSLVRRVGKVRPAPAQPPLPATGWNHTTSTVVIGYMIIINIASRGLAGTLWCWGWWKGWSMAPSAVWLLASLPHLVGTLLTTHKQFDCTL